MIQRKSSIKGPSQRQLRVGEEIRHILASVIMRNDWPMGELQHPVTVSRVDISPDLQNALAFIMPLGGDAREETLSFLKEMIPFLRKQLAKNIALRRVPQLKFVIDDSFDKAERMQHVFSSISYADSTEVIS